MPWACEKSVISYVMTLLLLCAMSLPSAMRRLRLRPLLHTRARCLKMHSHVAPSSSNLDSHLASAPPIPFSPSTPADYSALFRALGHRRFSEGYGPNTRPVALAQRHALTPRQLYLKMRSPKNHLKMRRSTETAVLTTALRAFVRLEDYAGALVVLRGMPADLDDAECALVIKAALHPLACRLYMERDSTRPRITRALLGAPSLSAAGWEIGSGSWAMPERAQWLISRLLKHNTRKAELELVEDEVEDNLRPVAFILRQMMQIHGGATKRKTVTPWREEEVKATEEMETRRRKKSKRPSTQPKQKPAPKTRQEIPLWEGETS
ncbi:hypothetical protein MSAN_00227800 [Mycena sanguinolenta]|uniref:Uncharacterized protein n=1 Tax=Mycena sanguinolenta TaxID=230812 RepID=A0A8H7DJU1_9AGAR|nr:hypothetical protein MSAN_00227800 [Mycena sanguinolenta]